VAGPRNRVADTLVCRQTRQSNHDTGGSTQAVRLDGSHGQAAAADEIEPSLPIGHPPALRRREKSATRDKSSTRQNTEIWVASDRTGQRRSSLC
jgi:hypothetical protein